MAAFHLGRFFLVKFRAHIFNAQVHAAQNKENPDDHNEDGNDHPDLIPELHTDHVS